MAQNQNSAGQDLKNTAQRGGDAIRAANTLAKTAAAAGSGNWAKAAAELVKNPQVLKYILLIVLIPIVLVLLFAISLPTIIFTDDGNDGTYDYTTKEGLQKTCEKIGDALASVYISAYRDEKVKIQQDARQRFVSGGYDRLLPVKYTGVSSEDMVDIDTEGLMAIYSVQQESLYEKELKEAEKNETIDTFEFEPPTLKQGVKKIKETIQKNKDLLFLFELENTREVTYYNPETEESKTAVEYTYRIETITTDILATKAFGLTETEEDPQISKYREKQEYLVLLLAESYADMQIGAFPVYASVQTIISDYISEAKNKFPFPGAFQKPLDGNLRITSPLGMRFHPILKTSKYHTGVDYGAPTGTLIKCIGDGVVIAAGYNGSYGNCVIVYHGEYNGKPLVSLVGHMSEIAISQGVKVKAGDVLGKVGSTGRSTGPHLHLELINGTEYLNPPDYY